MGIRLPNGTFVYLTTLEGFTEVERCFRQREPLIITVKELDGTERVEVIWHPNSPDVLFALPDDFPARKSLTFWQRVFGA